MIAGFFVFALGIQFTVQAGLGVSPWDVFHLGLGGRLGLSLGTVSVLTGLFIVGLAWPLGVRPRLATLLNMVLIGVFVDLIARWGIIPAPQSAFWGFVEVFLGYVLFGVGTGSYISANLGAGPRDSLMLALVSKTGSSVALVRTGIEGGAFLAGWLMGGPVGWGTLMGVALVGPATHLFLHLAIRLVSPFWETEPVGRREPAAPLARPDTEGARQRA